jgi:hypothetical protein
VFELKAMSAGGIAGALAKAERYRLLNEPGEAASICLDILEVEPGHQAALTSLILALTDQIPEDREAFGRALAAVPRLASVYDQAYYSGIAWERRAKATYHSATPGSHHYVHDWITQALRLFEQAERLRVPDNDDAILRWNACVRFLKSHRELAPQAESAPEPILSE